MHSMSDQSIIAAQGIGEEIAATLSALGLQPDYFIAALGNGISIRGPGQALKDRWESLKVVGFEPVESPTALKAWKSTGFEEAFKERAGYEFKRFSSHKFRGTGATTRSNAPSPIKGFKFLWQAISTDGFLHDIRLVNKQSVEELASELAKNGEFPVGPTSVAGIRVALDIASDDSVSDKVFVVVQYDPASKYALDGEWKYARQLQPFSIAEHRRQFGRNS